jgi:hypothetical protein
MPDAKPLAKARLLPLNSAFQVIRNSENTVTVQFNPESLKLSFANSTKPAGAEDKSGSAAKETVGLGTTKLSLQLWFDLTGTLPEGQSGISDVRDLTQKIVYFITPQGTEGQPKPPPGVRFEWGSFVFDGVVDSLEETLDFFSTDGKPLRASVSLTLSQQKTLKHTPAASGQPGSSSPGTRPLAQATAGATLQGLAAGVGAGANWQAIAQANGIENPRLLRPGLRIDLRIGN